MINFEDFAKLEIKIGTILSVARVDGADRLLLLGVDLGEEKERQIISGVAEHFPLPEDLVGKQVPVITNLEPRKIKGCQSEGMILYTSDIDGLTTLEPARKVVAGSSVK